MTHIKAVATRDARFDLEPSVGSDAIHDDPQYGYAVTMLQSESSLSGTGLAYTLGGGTDIICAAIEQLAGPLVGREIEELMSDFGTVQRSIAEHHRLRWLGPHKGVIHLALASMTNACFDLWAKHRGQPLWQLLLDLTPEQIADLIDFSYLDEALTRDDAIAILRRQSPTRAERQSVLAAGYPGYDTSVGWFQYSDEQIRDNARRAVDAGFRAMKLKVGSPDADRDVRRVSLVRDAVGPDVRIMLDANQAWSLPQAIATGQRLAPLDPYWIEEPTQPDDVLAHRDLADAIAPVPVAVGECVSNRVLWKNFLRAGAVGVVQADCTRLAGVSEFLAVVLMATQFPVKVIPHVGDMGQIHRHLVLFNHIALGHERLFLEHIPHLRDHFVEPADIENGAYVTPTAPGCGTDLVDPP